VANNNQAASGSRLRTQVTQLQRTVIAKHRAPDRSPDLKEVSLVTVLHHDLSTNADLLFRYEADLQQANHGQESSHHPLNSSNACPFPSWKNHLTVPSQAGSGLPCQQLLTWSSSAFQGFLPIISPCCNQQFQSGLQWLPCSGHSSPLAMHFGYQYKHLSLWFAGTVSFSGHPAEGLCAFGERISTRTQATATHPCSQTSCRVLVASAPTRGYGLMLGCFPNPTLLLPTAPKPLMHQKENQKEIAGASTRALLRQTRHASHRWPVGNQGQVSKAPGTCFNKPSTSQLPNLPQQHHQHFYPQPSIESTRFRNKAAKSCMQRAKRSQKNERARCTAPVLHQHT